MSNKTWARAVIDVCREGATVKPRKIETKELLCYTSKVPLNRPILTNISRKLGYKFMCAEAAWILSGDNRVATIREFSKDISNFSDDDLFFAGAYGPQVIEQLSYVVDCLVKDKDTRQAVMTIWRQNPRASRDTPCTVYAQWVIRNNKIHCFDHMRSSDLWLGWPYDIFNFSMLTYYIVLFLREKNVFVDLGDIYLTANSQHLYKKNESEAVAAVSCFKEHQYKDCDLSSFERPSDLVEHLWALARGQKENYRSDFLADLMSTVYDKA